MTAELRAAVECRALADQCRALADRMGSKERRQEMLKVAETWEVLAREHEHLDWVLENQ